VLGDIPYVWLSAFGAGPNCLAQHKDDLAACSTPREKAVLEKWRRVEKSAAAATDTLYVDVIPWFCTKRCYAVVDDIQVYSDWQHISATYAKYLSGSVQEALAPAGVE
jgi:hypothetical protein